MQDGWRVFADGTVMYEGTVVFTPGDGFAGIELSICTVGATPTLPPPPAPDGHTPPPQRNHMIHHP